MACNQSAPDNVEEQETAARMVLVASAYRAAIHGLCRPDDVILYLMLGEMHSLLSRMESYNLLSNTKETKCLPI